MINIIDFKNPVISVYEEGFLAYKNVFRPLKKSIENSVGNNSKDGFDFKYLQNNIHKELYESLNLAFNLLDLLISLLCENKYLSKESYLLIRIQDMMHQTFLKEKMSDYSSEELLLFLNIFESYVGFVESKNEIFDNISKEDTLEHILSNYTQLYNKYYLIFTEYETKFYSIVDLPVTDFEKAIDETYNALWSVK